MGPRAGPLTAVAAALALVAPCRAQEFHVDTGAENRVTFLSRASIEEFEGVTNRIDGYVLLDGDGVRPGTEFAGSRLYFEVDLASLDTGIGLRNRHMRDNYLEVEEHPYATFDGTVDAIAEDGAGFRVTSAGTFTVHGVEQPRSLECGIRSDGDGWRVACSFQVNLTDHDIEIPKIMFLKLAEDIGLELDFRLRPASGDQELHP